ncbi:MAG: hypothetical protein M3P18_11230 [Actinomycetota bacterium]|jgi:hypothetical protein|nr:hypothetical protein [Actinomycetota bacterium]
MVTGSPQFVSAFQPLYDSIVQAAPTVPDAIALTAAFEDARQLDVPRVYVSTAITSAGYKRDPTLDLGEVIRCNNAAAAHIMSSLVKHDAPQIRSADVMLPTELGKVPGWRDSDYLLYYFSWLAGLTPIGTAWLEGRMADSVYAPIRAIADDRERPNDERWPQYRAFAELMLTNLAVAESRADGKRAAGADILLQLIDTQESLGCRAEELYADVRGLDRLSVTFAAPLPDPLGPVVARLRELNASVGRDRKQVELVPVVLR